MDLDPADEQHDDNESLGSGGVNTGVAHSEDDEAAYFRLIFSIVYLAVGVGFIGMFYKNRNLMEIRARSAHLVLLLGVCLLIFFAININVECEHLFGWKSFVFWTHAAHFFVVFCVASCYTCRVIRLGVSFSPRIKRAVPWIMSEKLLVWTSITIGGLSVFIPGYYFRTTHGADRIVKIILLDLDVVWKSEVVLTGIQLALLPIVWMVDDLFRISWELATIVLLGLIDVVTIKLTEASALTPGVRVYLNSPNIGVVWAAALFGLSVIDPMRRLIYDPLATPVDLSGRVQARLRKRHTHTKRVIGSQEIEASFRSSRQNSQDDRDSCDSATEPGSTCSTRTTRWTYDKMAAVPAVAEAFRKFAWRALCQESVMFLDEVIRYENNNYEIARPIDSQFAAFNLIVKRFIDDGSPDEINISSRDKQKLLGIYKGGGSDFYRLDEEEKRLIFGEAYMEIRSMLEINLLGRFMNTDGFKKIQLDTPEPGTNSMFRSADKV